MKSIDADQPGTLTEQIASTRHRIVDRIWRGAGCLAAIELPIIAWRVSDIGWHPQIGVHLAICVIAISIALLRHRLPHALKSIGLVAAPFIVGTAGVVLMGMYGVAYFWVALTVAAVSMLFSGRIGVPVAVLTAAVPIASGWGFVNGHLAPPFDLNAHAVNRSAWLNFLTVTSIVPFVMLLSIRSVKNSIYELLVRVHSQRDQIAEQRDLLDQQRHQLEALATHDSLTGLPTRLLATDRLQMALSNAERAGHRVGLLFIDLDGFKAVNDAHGHEVGDLVLQEIALRLKAALRTGDTVARVGGDEFLVILHCLTDDSDAATAVARTLIVQVSRQIELAGHRIAAGASIGIALFPEHGRDMPTLRRLADAAMYQAKRSGKNRYCVATAEGLTPTEPVALACA